MRGTRKMPNETFRRDRFIPAYAGNAFGDGFQRGKQSVHPRVCGERAGVPTPIVVVNGSSPRMRGTPPERMSVQVDRRFIPAYAGNAGRLQSWLNCPTVHPRVCGERRAVDPSHLYDGGSSPRMRGTPAAGRRRTPDIRFIPAYAGNANAVVLKALLTSVHPRVCGERSICPKNSSSVSGSSPRMRGTPSGREP